jgi:hypothetical protein
MNRVALWILAQIIFLISAQAVPHVLYYAGQVTVNGEAFDGNGLFKFALVNTDGTTTYWSNDGTSVDGSEPQASVAIPVSGGLYAVLLGNTAQQGMGAIDPALFVQHSDAKLRVWFSDGVNGFQQLSPDRPFASVPYAFTAGTAQTAGSAPIANGAVNLDMLSQDVKTQINATIGLERLSSEIISKLEQNATITNGSVTGSKMADGAITTDKLNEQILKYLKPEITSQPQAQTVYGDSNVSFSVTAEGKYLTYQWKKDGVDLTGGTNATLNITDANATLHDGNYSVVVSNDFGSVESGEVEVKISDSLLNGLLAWWAFDGNGSDISGNDRHSTPRNTYSYVTGKVNQAIRIVGDSVNPGTGTNGGHIIIPYIDSLEIGNFAICLWVKEEQYHYNSGGEDYINFGSLLKIGNNEQLTFNSSVDSSINRNSWNHFSLNYGTVTKVGFLNGQQVMSDSWQIPSSVQYKKSAIGRHWWGGESQSSTRLTCLIDDVRIYDRPLSAEEVQALYNLGQ